MPAGTSSGGTMGCIDEDAVACFAQGTVSTEARREIEQHLDACPRCFAWVADAVRVSLRETSRALADTLPMPEPLPSLSSPSHDWTCLPGGTRLGRYEVLEQLGAGGMGVVYRAHDPVLRRFVALKLLRGDRIGGNSSSLRVQLLSEAHAMARLSHRNVVAVYDLGFVGDQIFVAMELIEGVTLRRWQEGRSWREILRVYLEAARGLDAAHDAGLVHRDFKPDNVLVAGDRVAVTDFGLACALDGDRPDGDAWAGTPAYMAPEQFRGEPADRRTDIFNFCASLYESLVGQAPFAGDTVVARRRAVLAGRVSEPEPRRIPRWLQAVLTRGLAADPAERPPSMSALTEALGHERRVRSWTARTALAASLVLVAGASAWVSSYRRPLASCRAPGVTFAERWSSLRPRMRAAFAVSGLPFAAESAKTVASLLDRYAAALATGYDAACQARFRDGTQSPATLDLRLACLDDRRAAADKLSELLAAADRALVGRAVEAASGLESIDACADVAALDQPVPPPRDARSRATLARARRGMAEARALDAAGRFTDAAGAATGALDSARPIGYAPLLASGSLLVGSIELDRGRFDDAEHSLESAVDFAERGHADLIRARALTKLIDVVGHRKGHVDDGERYAHQAEQVLARVGAPPREVADLAMRRGLLRMSQGRLPQAEADLRSALAARERALAADDPLIAITVANLASVLDAQDRTNDAEPLYRRAYALMSAELGVAHPRSADVLANIAGISYGRGKLRQAEAEWQRALEVQQRTRGPKHVNTAATLANLANVCDDLGQYEDALAYAQRALEALRAQAPDSLPAVQVETNLAIYLRELGRFAPAHAYAAQAEAHARKQAPALVGVAQYFDAAIYLDEERFDDAEKRFRDALATLQSASDPQPSRVADVLDGLGELDRDRGWAEEAIALHRRALATRERIGNGESLPNTLTALGQALLTAGQYEEARATLERAVALWTSGERGPRPRAVATFALARALVATHRDEARALSLASAAATILSGAPVTRLAREGEKARRWVQEQTKRNAKKG